MNVSVAIKRGDLDAILNAPVDWDAITDVEMFVSVLEGHFEIFQTILQRTSFDVDALKGCLIFAIVQCRLEIVELLLNLFLGNGLELRSVKT